MDIFLDQDGQQIGPFTKEQLVSMVAANSVSRDTFAWHEGLPDWRPLHSIVPLLTPVVTYNLSPSFSPGPAIQTNVKQGAVIGGWICLGLGLLFMVWSLFFFFLYGPLFLVAFILSIAAMSQKRIMGGIALLLTTLIVPSVLGIVLFAFRASEFSQKLSKSLEESSHYTPDPKKAQLLEKFRIVSSTYRKAKDSLGLEKPLIALTVQNDTEFSIKSASFRGVLASPGRAIPWIEDTFSYEIPGGLEPGEKANWDLAPNMFGEWGKADAPADAVLTVTVTRLVGADDKEL